ncbi:hypothetical protein [Crossiella sp. SN42]|uniref:hypothetical protein n=1 Tax=Crossiella sp. SN42 TaxID=2944808 RepID=UPI00273A69DD|nr:hypothetical protein [Crossiella sp. SN42]
MRPPPPKLAPKLILEGTRLTGKTELAFALNEHPRLVGPRKYRYHSPLISAEWCGFTNRPWGRGLINFAESEAELARETYSTWLRMFELQRYYSWLVDRFHLSTAAFQHRAGREFDFGWIEERLRPLGFGLVLCLREPATFPAARAERLTVSGNPAQYDDLSIFVREQEQLRKLAARSVLPVLELQVAGRTEAELAEEVADWCAASDLLGLRD